MQPGKLVEADKEIIVHTLAPATVLEVIDNGRGESAKETEAKLFSHFLLYQTERSRNRTHLLFAERY